MVSIVVLNQFCLKEMSKRPIKSFFYLSLKHATVDLGFKNFSDAAKHKSILNCVNNEWCRFMCLSGLSSVLKSQIHSFLSRYWGFNIQAIIQASIVPHIQNTQQNVFVLILQN